MEGVSAKKVATRFRVRGEKRLTCPALIFNSLSIPSSGVNDHLACAIREGISSSPSSSSYSSS